jgi:hypothetical protein
MRTLLVSALALGAFTSVAAAGPVSLTDAQMDTLTAGQEQTNTSSVTVSQSNSVTNGTAETTQSNDSTVTVNQSNSVSFEAPPT